VAVDPELAGTLSREEKAQGLAEAVKLGAILDPVYLANLETDIPLVLEGSAAATSRVVVRSVQLKAGIVSQDERESGLRKVLNFGHTLGHALEAALSFRIAHGSAVALGMVLEAELGEAVGVSEEGTAEALRRVVGTAGLPTCVPAEVDPEEVLAFTRTDKKGRMGRPRYVLLARPGAVAQSEDGDWTREVPEEAVREVLGRNREAG